MLMGYEEWMSRTRLGVTSIRPSKLVNLDRALNDYSRIPTHDNLTCLRFALQTYIVSKSDVGLRRDPRNGNNAVEDLYQQLFLGPRTLPADLKAELLKVAQGRIQGQIFGATVLSSHAVPNQKKWVRDQIVKVGHLEASNDALEAVAAQIKNGLDCKIAHGPLKTLESASRKVADDYNGDWYDLKDAVRVTVIATNNGQLTGVDPAALVNVKQKVLSVCVPSNGLSLIKNAEAVPGTADNPCGYSGLNFVVRLGGDGDTGGWPGEIQANIPAIMYGKMSQDDLCKIFRQDGYDSIKAELAIEGGISHVFYEAWRVNRTNDLGASAAALGTRYHDYLRNSRTRGAGKAQLVEDIKKFRFAPASHHFFEVKV